MQLQSQGFEASPKALGLAAVSRTGVLNALLGQQAQEVVRGLDGTDGGLVAGAFRVDEGLMQIEQRLAELLEAMAGSGVRHGRSLG
jgi:hypothetical protein